jgi:hypothetical protein
VRAKQEFEEKTRGKSKRRSWKQGRLSCDCETVVVLRKHAGIYYPLHLVGVELRFTLREIDTIDGS